MAQSLSHKPLLGRYQLQRELGRGTMGVVYLGLDRAANRYVAVKTICLAEILEEAQLDEIKSRLFQEAETIGRHDAPISLFDVCPDLARTAPYLGRIINKVLKNRLPKGTNAVRRWHVTC